jgi:hypothetical protein
MSRSRNIKPGFFLNDTLASLSPLVRILFAGLWTVCDRSGRVIDRPARIKAEVLPYDDCNVDEMLSQLAKAGFIDRYVVDGIAVLHVIAWDKHQNPHIKEAPSTLPCKCEHRTSTVQAPDKAQPIPELARLIPDSGFLIPSSLIPSSSEAKASAGKPANGKPEKMSSDEIIFGYGVPLLVNAGITDKAARSFLGGLRKAKGDAEVINALRDCIRARPLQPLEWLAKALPPDGVGGKQTAREKRNAAVVAELKGKGSHVGQ